MSCEDGVDPAGPAPLAGGSPSQETRTRRLRWEGEAPAAPRGFGKYVLPGRAALLRGLGGRAAGEPRVFGRYVLRGRAALLRGLTKIGLRPAGGPERSEGRDHPMRVRPSRSKRQRDPKWRTPVGVLPTTQPRSRRGTTGSVLPPRQRGSWQICNRYLANSSACKKGAKNKIVYSTVYT